MAYAICIDCCIDVIIHEFTDRRRGSLSGISGDIMSKDRAVASVSDGLIVNDYTTSQNESGQNDHFRSVT